MVDENHDNYLIPNVENIPFDFQIIFCIEKFRSNLDQFRYLTRVEFLLN